MTASSVQFLSSRRVQLVGLPQGATNRQLPSITNPAVSRITQAPTPQRVSRNLFGAPKAGEIEELLVKETAQRRSYMLQRYNFDILSPQAADGTATKSTGTQTSHQTNPLPCLIAKELKDHEKRLTAEGVCSPNRCSKAKISTIASHSSSSKSKQSEQEACSMYMGQGSERLKPYARQTLITDCYSLRKTNTGSNNKHAISFVVAPQPKQLDMLPLPKSIRAVESPISSSATYTDNVKEDSKSQQREPPYKQQV